ncbi:unnamed protein product [Closterium sp. NIES-64]|nr:unnamed protein product [Closterium sp. NIES-64]
MLASLMLRQVGGGTVGSLASLPSVPCIRHFHAPHHSVDHNLLHLTSTSPPLLHPSPPSPAVCHCHFHLCHCYAPHHSVNHSLLHLTSTSPPLLQNPPSPLPLLLSCKTPHLPSLSPSLATLPPAYAIAMLPITVWITVFLSRLNMAI